MKNTDARKILGLDPSDDPRSFIPDFEETISYKKELVNNAPSEEMKFRYQQELLEYEAAVKVVVGKRKVRPHTDFVVVLLLIAAVSSIGWWGFQWYQEQWNAEAQTKVKIAQLQSEGRAAVAARKWDLAQEKFETIQSLSPESQEATDGFKSIEQGKLEERNQFIFYNLGESQAAIEAGRWGDAEKLLKEVLKLDPENLAAKRKLEIVTKGRKKQDIALRMSSMMEALRGKDLTAAKKAFEDFKKTYPSNPNIALFANRISTAELKIKADQKKALSLYQEALKLDSGEYTAKAISLLTEARRLYPTSHEILALYKKMSAYTRAINVPADFPTISKAIAAARPNDLIRIAPGLYEESLIIEKPIRLIGSADGSTKLSIPAKSSPVITITAQAAGTSITGVDVSHFGYDYSTNRYSAITIQAQKVSLISCRVFHAAGHGIAILDGGNATIKGCKITKCSWDGISVYGAKSQALIKDTTCQSNLHHGVEFWNGGEGTVLRSIMRLNGLCGVLAMGKDAKIIVQSTTCISNREAGIFLSDGVRAALKGNICKSNLLSGIVVKGPRTLVNITDNITQSNHEVGILIYQGVKTPRFENNKSSKNTAQQILRNAPDPVLKSQ